MKSLTDIKNINRAFDFQTGLNLEGAVQGSPVWFQVKLGVLSASCASKIVAKKDSETRATYMAELVAQICTGQSEEISSKYLDWGNKHEDAARSSYEFQTGSLMNQVPFVFKDLSFREGCSPDGLLDNKGAEIKCPFNAAHYIKFYTEDKIKPEYVWQYQYTLRVMEADEWDFVQYHPLMKKNPLKILTVKRDAEKQKIFDDMVPAFIEDMDAMLAKIGIEFGSQWRAQT